MSTSQDKAKAEAEARAAAYEEIVKKLATGAATSADLQLALAMQMDTHAQLSATVTEMMRRQNDLEDRILKTRERRPDDVVDMKPTPAMIEETMRRNAYHARVARAAQASGYLVGEWQRWCELHEHDPTCRILTSRTGEMDDERQETLPLTHEVRSPSTKSKKHRKPKPRRATG